MYTYLLIIDGNNFYARGYYRAKTKKEHPLEFTLNMVRFLKKDFPNARLIFTFDTCKSRKRLDLYPEYKANRKTSLTPEEHELFKKMLNDFMEIMRYSGYSVIEGDGYEADDYIACLTQLIAARYDILVISTDSDMLQLINSKVKIFDPIKQITISDNNFIEIVGIPKQYLVDYKAMTGEPGDNIIGIENVGDVTAKKYINKYGNYEEIVEGLKQLDKIGKRDQNIIDGKAIVERNRKLVDLALMKDDRVLQGYCKTKILKKLDITRANAILAKYELGHVLKMIRA